MLEASSDTVRDRVRRLSGEQVARAYAMLGDVHASRKTLVAYVVLDPGSALDASDVRRKLVDSLPRTSIPARIVILDDIPRTQNGKEDLVRLLELCEPGATTTPAPRRDDVVEELVNAIWSRELGLSDGAEATDFFAAGGTSLTAIRTLTAVNAGLALEMPLVAMFRHAQPAAFTAYVREHAGVDAATLDARAASALQRLDTVGR